MSAIDRRDLLKLAVAASLGIAVPGVRASPRADALSPEADSAARTSAAETGDEPKRGLSVLILGGTGFLGPHIVETARARGHTLTLFNRGKTNPGLFPDLEKLQGDRKSDLTALEGRTFDAVIDTSGYFPADVRRSAQLLADAAKQYVFISTVSVYADLSKPVDESSAVATTDAPDTDKITNESYGPLKALCEQAAEAAFPGRTTVIRPGLIVGPGDPTDRFTYWPARVARGGEVLAPDAPSNPTQLIDGRDLADFIVTAIERSHVGVYNADAQAGSMTMGDVLASCAKAANNDARITWVPWPFLEALKVTPWQELPIWLPPIGENAGFGQVSAAKAKAVGLTYRPLDETVRDTLAWYETWPADRKAKLRAGLTPEREAEVLKAWHAQGDAIDAADTADTSGAP